MSKHRYDKKIDLNIMDSQPKNNEKQYWFYNKLKCILFDKYDKDVPLEYLYLLNSLQGTKYNVPKSAKKFRLEKTMETLIDELSPDERYKLIPDTVEESKIMKKTIKKLKMESAEDTIWRKITGYANLNFEFIKALAKKLDGKKVLEIMSGNGLLSYMLRENGVDVFATDIAPDKYNDYIAMRSGNYGDIKRIDAVSAVKKYGSNVDYLLCSWPPQGEVEIIHALEAFNKIKKQAVLIYIGEDKGGVNATNEFFDRLDIVDEMHKINSLHVSNINSNDKIRMVRLISN